MMQAHYPRRRGREQPRKRAAGKLERATLQRRYTAVNSTSLWIISTTWRSATPRAAKRDGRRTGGQRGRTTCFWTLMPPSTLFDAETGNDAARKGRHFEPPPQTQTRTANNKSPKAAASVAALFARHGSVSFDQASFEYELKNATSFVDLTGNVPSSLEEFRIVYPGTKLHIGAGPEGAAAMWSVKYSYS